MTQAQMLRKITIANTGWNKVAIMAALANEHADQAGAVPDGSKISLMKIVGETTSAEPGQTDKGEFLKLKGAFKAINSDTGEMFDAPVCILPNFIADQLGEALKTSERVEFAIEVGAKAKSSSVTGYEFTATPLLESKPTDSMLRLMDAAGITNAPALEAPKASKKGK